MNHRGHRGGTETMSLANPACHQLEVPQNGECEGGNRVIPLRLCVLCTPCGKIVSLLAFLAARWRLDGYSRSLSVLSVSSVVQSKGTTR